MNEKDIKQKYKTLTESAKILSVSRQAVHQMIQAGKLNAFKMGRLLMINSEDFKNIKKRY